MTILNALLPPAIDNTYRGQKIALWIFGVILLLKTVMSVNSIINGYAVASTADGIPLATYPASATQTIVALFALFGLSHFTICAICTVVLIRYRSAVPLMFLTLLLEHATRRLIVHGIPIVRTGSPPAVYVNSTLLALMVVGLALSLLTAGKAYGSYRPERRQD